MELGKLGVWSHVDHLSAPEAAAFAQRAEGWGYSAPSGSPKPSAAIPSR